MSEEINEANETIEANEDIGTKGKKERKKNRGKAKRRIKKEFLELLIFLAVLGLIAGSYAWYRHATKFDYVESLPEIVVTVSGTNISLQEISYYVMKMEEQGNEYAKQYNPDNLKEYWNLYMNKGEGSNSGYVSGMSKDAVMNYCIRDNIYFMEAQKAEVELLPEEIEEIRYDAQNAYETMTNKQRKMTQLSAEDFQLIMEKEQLAYKYMAILAENYEGGPLEGIVLQYDVGGTYYEALKATYSIEINQDLWDEVRMGFVTIN